MQESGHTTPIDEGPVSGSSASDVHDNDAFFDDNEPAAEQPREQAPSPQLPQRQADPVIRWLTLGIAAVIIFWLVGILSAMMFGVLAPSKAPRTAAERDLLVLQATVDSGKADSQTYANYVATLINAGELSKAQAALNQALPVTKTNKSYLLTQQASLYFAKKDYQGAVEYADKAMAEAKKEIKAYMDANVQANRKPGAGVQTPQSYSDAALIKANAFVASNDYKSAVKAYDVYIAEQPTDSDILVARAQAKIKIGDKTGAAADFRAALKYIPDYQPALDGLKQIGATR